MNRIFRIIWSKSMRAWIVVSELATPRGKAGRTVDERRAPVDEALDRDMMKGSPPTAAWPLRMGILLALLTTMSPAWAANRWWDANGSGVGQGGTGTWGAPGVWNAANDGVAGPFTTWNNGALDDAFFGGTAGTVTLAAPVTVHNITFEVSGYTLTGSTLTLGGTTPTVTATGNATINSTISSTSGFRKAGAGGLTLTGNNTFNGGGISITGGGTLALTGTNTIGGDITVTSGGLSVNGDAALGAVGNDINIQAGASLAAGNTNGGGLSANRVVNLMGTGGVSVSGAGVGSAFYTGTGGLGIVGGVTMSNNANNYTGATSFGGNGSRFFTSIGNLGEASSLGAPTTVANGTITFSNSSQTNADLTYVGDGDVSNRNWIINPGSGPGGPRPQLNNNGSGTLTLTGNIALGGGSGNGAAFNANTADLELLGVISSNNGRTPSFIANTGRTLRLGGANTYSGATAISGGGNVVASVLANSGVNSSLGSGSSATISGTLLYDGTGASSDRTWNLSSGTLSSSGTGALNLTGPVTLTTQGSLGGNFAGANVISGVVSGSGNLRSTGSTIWTLTGNNTYTGTTIVDGGTLRAGAATAFGASTALQVNGGTADLNDFNKSFTTLAGTGGIVDLGSAILTINGGTGVTSTYSGNITGTGGLTKLGASTLVLKGANTYTGDTSIGGGILTLDFTGAGGPTSNIVSSDSALKMNGGRINITGAAGENNTQTFDGLFVTAGNNTINATSGAGGSMTVNLGAITRTGGLINFNLPTSGNITTSNTMLGGWATVNGTDYAKVVGGNITAFTDADYTDKDNAANWLADEFITDVTGFFGTVGSSVQLGGLRYTVPKSTTVTIGAGQTLGVDGTIIVAPSVLNTDQVITGGTLTGANGGVLGIQQNSTGNFTINSLIVDNGPGMGFVKAGTGLVTLSNPNNTYTGATRVAQGTLAVVDINDGGMASSIGASSADPSNLILEGATLRYNGTTSSSDRGFTFGKSGAIVGSGVDVTNAGTNLTFSGLVTSTDGANFTKGGAGTLTLSNDTNDFTGIVTVTGGLLSVDTLANGGVVSGIGAGGSASANLVLNGGGLQYTGATASTDRGFTLGSSNGTIDVSDPATTLTVSGTATGAGRLTKNGTGTLVLSATNTYTGGNTVNAGILRAGATNAFGTGAVGSTTLANVAGATLDLNNFNNIIGPLNGGGANGGNVTLGSGRLTIQNGDGTYNGVISGTGGVTRTGSGTQTFTGCNNTYTGSTNLQATLSVNCLANGGLASGIGASSNASSSLQFNNGTLVYTGGTITIDRGFQLVGNVGAINVNNAATTLGLTGQVIGGGSFRKDGPGTLVLSGTNTSTGNTQVTGGVLRAGATNAFGPTGHMTLDNTVGVVLDLNNFNTVVTSLIGGGTTGGNISLGSATLTINSVDTRSYAGAISGIGNLVKNGDGTQALTNCNSSYSGTTTVNAGVLQVNCLNDGGVNSSIGASTTAPANLVLNGGTLRYVGAGSSTNREWTLGTAGGTLDASGTGIVEFTDAGPVTLSGANVARTLTLTGTNTGYNLFAGTLSDNGAGATSLTKTGTGTWRLTNANSTYTGVTRINGGVLSVDQMADGGQASSIGASSNAAANLVIGNGSTLRYTGAGDSTDRQFTLDTGVTFIESSGTGALQFTNTGAVALTGTNTARTIALGGTNTGANTLGGTIGDNGTGVTTLAKNDSGTWILTGNNTYTGNTVINNGNLMIGNGGTTGNAGAGNVIVDSPTSTLSINRSDTFAFNGTLSGPGTLAQIGTGTTVLTSANNDIGATTIGAGTLEVQGGLTTPTIAMSGTSGLTVDGTVRTAGGTQTAITGDGGVSTITVNAGGSLLANGDLGDGNDIVDVAGTLDSGAAALNLGAGDDTLTIHDGTVIGGAGVNAGTGAGDSLVIDNANDFTFDAANIAGFEQLTKQNAGVLTTTGVQTFSAGTAIEGGTLDVDGVLVTPTLDMADNTVLNVDGTVEGSGGAPTAVTGSTGSNTLAVNDGATLRATGDLGDGSDVVALAGTLDTGAGVLGLGDGSDQLILRDGATLIGGGVDAGAGANDSLLVDVVQDFSFDGGQTAGFETLLKNNTGTATMTGSQSFTNGTIVAGGELDIDGALETPSVALGDGATLNVDGTVQAAGGAAAVLTGVGENIVQVGAGGTLLANGDLGDGNDVLDVAGTLDTGGGILALGDGDDTLTIHDNTNILGTVSAGNGNDTFDTHIDTVANLGAVQGFETLSKTGTGELNINGLLPSDFTAVNVLEGTLDITAGGNVIAPPGGTLDTVVASGATLNVDGSYGCGNGDDTMTVAGTVSGAGTIDLCDGNDTLTLQDGALLTNTIDGGLGSGDALVLDNALAFTFDAGNTTGFEQLRKDNVGTATLVGNQSFLGGTTITGGTLDVDGTLETPTVALADNTVLNVDGVLNAGPVAPTIVSGSAGSNNVTVGAGGTALATGDLGDGVDTLDVFGTLDTVGGVFSLGAGDDNFVVHDGTMVLGTVDGGAGLDTRTYDINGNADLGALLNFEGVTKTGTGTLNINGPAATDLQEVQVLGGILNIDTAASVVATAGSSLNTLVGAGATLNVDGSYGCGAGADTMNVSGAVSGSGTINLCGGDDTLTLNDGADLSGLANAIDGDAGAGDTVVLNNASAMTLDAGDVANFEILQKDNAGTATLTGNQSWNMVALNGGTLDVDGSLVAPTLTMADGTTFNVDGSAGGGPLPTDAMTITGSAGVNNVFVNAGAVLVADGDLGAGNDVLDVAGTLDIGGGTFGLGDGDDTLSIHDGTAIAGTVAAGAGNDTLNADIDTVASLGAVQDFETLSKTGAGVLNINGPASSDFTTVNLLDGTLDVTAAGSVAAQNTTVAAGTTLNVAGDYTGTSGNDTMTVAGTVTGTGTVDLLDGDDTFTLQDGADLSGLATSVSGGAGTDTFVADLAGNATLGGAVDFETLTKTNSGTLNIDGPAASAFTTVNVDGGILDIGPAGSINGVVTTTVLAGATMNVDGSFTGSSGNDTMTVAGTIAGSGTVDLGDGDDTLTLQDGADLSGLANAVNGGNGDDTLVADIAGTAALGGITNFDTLTKTNSGTLVVAGPAPSDFTTVNVDGGTLDIGAAGSISGVVTTTVANGARLNVDGSFSGSAGDDTMTVAGAITGGNTIAFDDGDDTLTLNDGADLSGFSGVLDGGAHSGGDTVALNNASALTFGAGAVVNFEFLNKTNTGTATLTGAQSYSGGSTLAGGELVVEGALTTPTLAMADDTALTVNGTLDAGGAAAAITGSAGANTVTVAGTLVATGDLGDGNDVLDVAGTLDTTGGIFALGDGDDTLTIHDGTSIVGTVAAGAGNDTFNTDIDTVANLGAVQGFETLSKTGAGTLNINGLLSSDFSTVNVLQGTLDVTAGGIVVAAAGSPLNTVVGSGATLNVDGSYGCGSGNDTMTVAGTVSGTGTIDLCGGEDTLKLQDGAALAAVISGGGHGSGDTVVLDNSGDLSFDAANTINFEFLQKDNAGEATLLGAQSFTGGTTVNGGTLTVAGQLETPTVALADSTTLNVDGRLQAAGGTVADIAGSAGANTVNVSGTLLAEGDLGEGNDRLDVAGTLDTGGGDFVLGGGDDTLTIHDNTNIVGTVVAGAGNDTFNADIASVANLGAVQDFETLSKTGAGELNINGPMSSDFTTVNVLGGTLDVTSGGSVMAQTTTVAAAATLNVDGSYSGTSGDDTFTSSGTVRGAFAFGDGNDTVAFNGGNPSGVTALDGGAGTDLLSFSGLELEDDTLPALSRWERVELLNNSSLSMGSTLDLSGGVLAIDATSRIFANANAGIGGSVENAGLIDVGANRFSISGGYTANDGQLHVTVSPGTLSAGGLNIQGDVAGTTRVAFTGNGSDFVGGGTASILVISSPNDNAATAGSFVPADSVNGAVRLNGSIHPWSFGQQPDNNWYLNAEAGLLPETPAYGVLNSLGLLMAQSSDNLVHQRLAGIRDSELPQCGKTPTWPVERSGTGLIDDCRGVWVAATGSELELGANPGFEVSGDDVGLYVGVDSAFDRPGRTLRGGLYAGYRHGNYWTTGVNSSVLPGSGEAKVAIDTAIVGMYMSHTWDRGGYINFVLTGQLPKAKIRTPDGFRENISGNSLTLSSRVGKRYFLDDGWMIEPQLQLSASAVGWGDRIDSAGKQLVFDDDVQGSARAALRVEKRIVGRSGAVIRPWAAVAVQKTVGAKDNTVSVLQPGDADSVQMLPNHDLGATVSLDVGLEATLNQRVSLFGVVSIGKDLEGTDFEQREANLGLRVRW